MSDLQPWVMPDWMEPFRELIHSTGGNPVEELMNDHDANAFNNVPRAMVCVAVKSQVGLLETLYACGHLGPA
jgi:hypothetical protein